MTQTGTVVRLDGRFAYVSVERHSACDSCHQKASCSFTECPDAKPVEAKVINTAGAKVGDMVELSASSSLVLSWTFCVFVFPILLAFAAYLIALRISGSTMPAYIAAGAAFGVGILFFCIFLNRRLSRSPAVEISKIL